MKGFFCLDYEPEQSVAPGESVSFHTFNAAWHWDPGDVQDKPEGGGPRARRPVRGARREGGPDARRPHRRGDAARMGRDVRATASGSSGRSTATRGAWARTRCSPRRSSASSACRRPSRASTRQARRAAGAATSTASSSSPGRRSTCRSPSTVRCSWPATATARRATAKSRALRSKRRSSARTLTLELSDLQLRSPIARTNDSWLAFGFDDDLDAAAAHATETMLDLMERELGISRNEALAVASVSVDLHVTQVVNGAKGVHAILRA